MKPSAYLKTLGLCFAVLIILIVSSLSFGLSAFAMPFYDLQPKDTVLRAKFTTDYAKSSEERKHNIKLAAKALDKVLVDVNGEFSFNTTVGARTEKRGYKSAKIIVKGEFVEGVGGGVCQVSTTLYNAALLAGMHVTECHAHSLSVNYVEPSFDAMVNSGSADLRFINETHNPIILRAKADGEKLTISVYGEPMAEKYYTKSVVKREISPEYMLVKDEENKYPDLYLGERKILIFGKKGMESEGFLIKTVKGKTVSSVRIRRDKYSPINGVMVEGTAIRPSEIKKEEIA